METPSTVQSNTHDLMGGMLLFELAENQGPDVGFRASKAIKN